MSADWYDDTPLFEKMEQISRVSKAKREGHKQGKELQMSNTENLTMLDKANLAWRRWAEDNNVAITNTQPETYRLMSEAFVDGYLKGFAKRLTEGA